MRKLTVKTFRSKISKAFGRKLDDKVFIGISDKDQDDFVVVLVDDGQLYTRYYNRYEWEVEKAAAYIEYYYTHGKVDKLFYHEIYGFKIPSPKWEGIWAITSERYNLRLVDECRVECPEVGIREVPNPLNDNFKFYK